MDRILFWILISIEFLELIVKTIMHFI